MSSMETSRTLRASLFAGIAVFAVGAILSGCEDGSYFNSNTVQMKSDKVGRLEAFGEDLRVYEFTPQTAPNSTCIFVAGEKKGGLVCIPKS